MKNAWKKAWAIVLCVLLMVTVVAGCDPQDDGGKTTTSSSSTTTASTGDATDPSATDPSVTDPSATDPSATDPSATDPSVTDPSASDSTTSTQAPTTKPTKKPTSVTLKPPKGTTVTTTVTTAPADTDRATVKVGNVTIHSDKIPYVSGGSYSFSLMLPNSNENVSMDKQAAKKILEERSGMKVDYMYYKHSDIFVLKSTMLNSGNIPDLFFSVPVGFKCYEASKYGKEGFFADLTDKLETWMPNLYGKMHSGQYNYAKTITYAPGKVYSLPTLFRPSSELSGQLEEFQPMINTAWLDELGLEIPKTTDEFYEVCKAFTEEDPDGNGKNDTFGYGAPIFSPQIWNPWGLGMSWYVHGAITEKGEVQYGPITDQFREGCRFWNRMWEEGLMCKNMFGASDAAKKSLVAKTGIVSCSYISTYLTDSELKNWKAISWPKGENTGDFKAGITISAYSDSYENMFFVSKKTKSVEAILRWLDYFYTAEGAMLWHNGPKGVAYDIVGGKYKMKKNASELVKDQKVISSVYPMEAINVMDRSTSEMTVREQFSARINKESMDVNKRNTYHFYWLDQLASEADMAALEKIKTPGDWNWGVQAIRGDADIETEWNSYKNQYSGDYAAWKKVYQGIFDRYFK